MSQSSPFRFKKFEVSHSRSSMKVGVDGVLVGCWARLEGASRILDVGTGCGVVALVCAQRSDSASVLAIDIDPPSVEEAALNFAASPFASRLEARLLDFLEMKEENSFDAIVTNPPFFDSGIRECSTAREIARHEVRLPLIGLIENSRRLLTQNGTLTIILPYDRMADLIQAAVESGMTCTRLTIVRGHAGAVPKRLLAELRPGTSEGIGWIKPQEEEIVMMEYGIHPTQAYHKLTRDFYLKY